MARVQSRSYSAILVMRARAANSAGGGKTRVSLRTLVMFAVLGEVDIAAGSKGAAGKSLGCLPL